DVPLNGFSVRIVYQNESIISIKREDLNISDQDIQTIEIETDKDIKQVIVQSLQCRGAQDLIGRYDIQGIGFKAF
ncbi:MAG: hypothetical protein QW625_02975, partial [Candidatus Nanoarchaeia archaeon]